MLDEEYLAFNKDWQTLAQNYRHVLTDIITSVFIMPEEFRSSIAKSIVSFTMPVICQDNYEEDKQHIEDTIIQRLPLFGFGDDDYTSQTLCLDDSLLQYTIFWNICKWLNGHNFSLFNGSAKDNTYNRAIQCYSHIIEQEAALNLTTGDVINKTKLSALIFIGHCSQAYLERIAIVSEENYHRLKKSIVAYKNRFAAAYQCQDQLGVGYKQDEEKNQYVVVFTFCNDPYIRWHKNEMAVRYHIMPKIQLDRCEGKDHLFLHIDYKDINEAIDFIDSLYKRVALWLI